MKALVVLLGGLALCAQMHPLQELIEAARAHDHRRLKTLLAGGLPGLKGRDGAAVWGQEPPPVSAQPSVEELTRTPTAEPAASASRIISMCV